MSTYSWDIRPKDLRLPGGPSQPLGSAAPSSSVPASADVELNGTAIKERLMANRLPESCVWDDVITASIMEFTHSQVWSKLYSSLATETAKTGRHTKLEVFCWYLPHMRLQKFQNFGMQGEKIYNVCISEGHKYCTHLQVDLDICNHLWYFSKV
jgi:hypothetical protein